MSNVFYTYIMLLFSLLSFCQRGEKRTYYFDYMYITKNNIHNYGEYNTTYNFINSKDSTYFLNIKFSNDYNSAEIIDFKDKYKFVFDSVPNYKSIIDLKLLDSCTQYTTMILSGKHYHKNILNEVQYEHDTIDDIILVHELVYKNIKKKKVNYEVYYFFSKKKNLESDVDYFSTKNYFITKHKINELKDYYLEKILFVKDSKINSERIFLKNEKIDYNLTFSIKKVI